MHLKGVKKIRRHMKCVQFFSSLSNFFKYPAHPPLHHVIVNAPNALQQDRKPKKGNYGHDTLTNVLIALKSPTYGAHQ